MVYKFSIKPVSNTVLTRNDSIVLSLINEYSEMQAEDIAANLLSKTCFTGYPFLVESRVLQLSDELFTYNLIRGQVIATPHDDVSMRKFNQSATRAESHYSTRYGVVTGPIEMTAKVEVLKQLVLNNDGSLQKEFVLFEEYDVPVQLLVFGDLEDPRLKVFLF
jgi:5'-3' exoribonuclease 1